MQSIDPIIQDAWREGRRALYEHEVGELLSQFNCFTIPRYVFAPDGKSFDQADIDRLGSASCVLKLVAPELTHKSDIGAVRTVIANADEINHTTNALLEIARRLEVRPAGVLCCEHIEFDQTNLAGELFVGIRVSREFGPVLAAGFGGVQTEFLATVLRREKSVALAVTDGLSADAFLKLFKRTACYDLLAGRVRGTRRTIDDGALLDCFDAFIKMANTCCTSSELDGPCVSELEVNPFAIADGKLIPLDGVCRLASSGHDTPPRPLDRIGQLLHPESIAIVGVSNRSMNIGRVILNNVIAAGFNLENLWVIKSDVESIDQVRCVEGLSSLPQPVDLLVVAVSASQAVRIAEDVIEGGRAKTVILIPGGMGETESGHSAEVNLRNRIIESRRRNAANTPMFLGGNCLGVLSRPGNYDTLFISGHKLDKHSSALPQPVALVSQSGAFAITRLSNLNQLIPQYVVTCGNQTDLTVSDCLRYLIERTQLSVFGVYVEGFADLDGLAMTRAIREATSMGKIVVFYKAGRTPAGRRAIEGHTAAIAGDYITCTEAMTQAGALVADTFGEFESALMLAVASLEWRVNGSRFFALSNAGFEAVGIADHLDDTQDILRLAHLTDERVDVLSQILERYNLTQLVNIRNPLDVTPMASDAVHLEVLATLLGDPEVDGVIHCFVPQTPAMKTTRVELTDEMCLVNRIPEMARRSGKPVVIVIDSGRIYDAYVNGFTSRGMAVFRSADVAVSTLDRLIRRRVLAGAQEIPAWPVGTCQDECRSFL